MLRVVPNEAAPAEEPVAPQPAPASDPEPQPVTVLPSVRPGPVAPEPEPEPELPNAAVEVSDDFDTPLAFAHTEPPPAEDEEPSLVVKQTRTCGVELPLDVHAVLAVRARANGNTLKQEVLKMVLIGLAK